MAGRPRRFDVYLIVLDPVRGSEIAKTRPCVVVSPDEINEVVRTLIVVPLTSRTREHYTFRVRSRLEDGTATLPLTSCAASTDRGLSAG